MSTRVIKLQNLKLALRTDSGLSIGSVFPLHGKKRSILGRSVDADVPVDDVKASRVHAAIDEQNGFHFIVDLGSTNGTYLNGSRVQTAEMLNVGDEIRVGSTVFKIEFLDQAKLQVSNHWRESTRVLKDPKEKSIASASQLILIEKESVFKNQLLEESLKIMPKAWKRFLSSIKISALKYGKFLTFLSMIVVVAAAILVTAK